MKIKTTIQFTEWERNSKTGNRKIKRIWSEFYESNGLVQPSFEMDSHGNLKIALWCKEQFCEEYDDYHFVFIKTKKNVETDIFQTIVDTD